MKILEERLPPMATDLDWNTQQARPRGTSHHEFVRVSAALSGRIPKAPGFAGGFLLPIGSAEPNALVRGKLRAHPESTLGVWTETDT